jgi:hypothetical protein
MKGQRDGFPGLLVHTTAASLEAAADHLAHSLQKNSPTNDGEGTDTMQFE